MHETIFINTLKIGQNELSMDMKVMFRVLK